MEHEHLKWRKPRAASEDVVDAIQWTGANVEQISTWAYTVSKGGHAHARATISDMHFDYTVRPPRLTITTNVGNVRVTAGDYVIKTRAKGLIVMAAEAFLNAYEPITPELRVMHHLRFMATTAESPAGRAALAYLRAVIRIAPVRLVNLSGALDARWEPMGNLLLTPMDTPMLANIVCTDPDRWAYRLSIPMPKKDPFAAALARGSDDGKALVVKAAELKAEKAERLVELYTAGTRNVLIATSVPPSKTHCTAAARYEAVIVPSEDLADKFEGAIGRRPLVIPYPVVEHGALRAAIIS